MKNLSGMPLAVTWGTGITPKGRFAGAITVKARYKSGSGGIEILVKHSVTIDTGSSVTIQ